MNTTKKSNGYSSIRSKLIAAVAMLLVASFMVVSSSYAWFTLSTAPEVTGISTSVGANGNLEMALYTGGTIAASNVGDSGNNTTWGNLVDLSAESYHLQDISLKPAELNVTVGNKVTDSTPLLVPVYGNDGRVSSLSPDGIIKGWDTDYFKGNALGVRAIGTASGMSAQQIDHMNASSTMKTQKEQIKIKAQSSLNAIGNQLAQVVVEQAMGTNTSTKTYNISDVIPMLTDLTAANNALAAHIKAWYLATVAKAAQDQAETAYSAIKNAFEAKTVDELVTGFTSNGITVDGATEGSPVKKAYDIYTKTATNIGTASAAATAEGVSLSAATWEEVTAILFDSGLVKYQMMTANGYTADQLRVQENMDAFASKALSEGISVGVPSGSGVYSDFAEVAGNYAVSIVISSVSVGGFTATNLNAKMNTTVEGAPTITLTVGDAPTSSGDNSAKITDYYGYAIDLAFRTNAAGSSLMLQTEAANRIYSGNTGSAATQGAGSTMTFESMANDFTAAQMKELMKSIRIVFVDQSFEIKGVGVLTDMTEQGTQVTGKIKLTQYEIVDTDPGDGEKLRLQLKTTAEGQYDWATTASLGALAQNTQQRLSVLVYLDGNTVENSDVAATSATSMKGTMNLQFASDASLVPMDYSEFKNQATPETPEP